MSFWGFRPYVTVAQRRAQAAREVVKLKKEGRAIAPVVIEGRKIARTFWGKAWCDNLTRYSDYANRLPRGRTYVNNGSVIDLKISRGEVVALVSGSDIYKVKIDIAVAAPPRWRAICADCAGSVGSLVELLQGKLSKNVMERVCREADGLFPTPREIGMSCSCPDSADMCKHVAATLYGVGARLDSYPDLLFALRGVDRDELIVNVGVDLSLSTAPATSDRMLATDDVAALFGLEMDEATVPPPPKVRGRERNASQGRPASTPPESTAPATRVATGKTNRQKIAQPGKRKASAAPALPVPSTTQKPSKPKAVSGKRAEERRPPPKPTQAASIEAGDTPAAADRRGVAAGHVGRTRAAKWIGARARKRSN